jgi:hypothetical protein
MYIAGNDGTDLALAAEIRVEVDGVPGSNDMPGRILLRTTPDGSQAPVDAVKIDSAQNVTVSAGNLVIGTSGKGIDFSANTPAAGMTSQLLNWYEEGTWTPIITGTTTIGTANYVSRVGKYTRIGRNVFFECAIDWNTGTGAGSLRVGNLQFTPSASATYTGVSIGIMANVVMAANTYPTAFVRPGSAEVSFRDSAIGGGASNDTAYDAAGFVSISGTYTI